MTLMTSLADIGRRALGLIDPEKAHQLTVQLMQTPLATPSFNINPDATKRLTQTVAGIKFPNPVGLAAGFDKNAEITDALLNLGFGFVEAGAATPQPQPGNPRPRVFRLREDRAVINRYGFNNDGHDVIKARLIARGKANGLVGINLGANKQTSDKTADYIRGLKGLAPHVDFCTINISSPNTPGLRALQDRASLEELLQRIFEDEAACKAPVFLKIAPDIDDKSISDIIDIMGQHRISALIISNTTTARPHSLISSFATEGGGLSGKPLFTPSTQLLRSFARELKGAVPLIGVGGISSPREAYLKILAGASLIQLYTALIYEGPALPSRIVHALPDFLDADGFDNISEAVGADI